MAECTKVLHGMKIDLLRTIKIGTGAHSKAKAALDGGYTNEALTVHFVSLCLHETSVKETRPACFSD